MFGKIAAFELRYQLRQPIFWIAGLIFFLIVFAATAVDVISIGSGGNVHKNSPRAIGEIVLTMTVFFMFASTAFVANVIVRDDETGFGPIIRSTQISKFDYLYGRFTGAFGAVALSFLFVPLGIVVGSMMWWVDPETMGPNNVAYYAFAYFWLALPGLFLVSAIFFSLATATRSMMATYLGVAAFLVLYITATSMLQDPDKLQFAAFAEPFGVAAWDLATRYFTASEANSALPPIAGPLLWNRLIWAPVSLAVLSVAYFAFRFEARGARERKRGAEVRDPPPTPRALAKPRLREAAVPQLIERTRFEMRQVFLSPAFIVLLLIGLFNSAGGLLLGAELQGAALYPVTRWVIRTLEGNFTLVVIVIAIYYAGELVWRERDRKTHEIIDATPAPDWTFIVPKTIALTLVLIATLLVSALAGIAIQLSQGFLDIQVEKYLVWYILPTGLDWTLVAILAVFFQALSPHKFVGWGLMVLYLIASISLSQLGFEHVLYNYGAIPDGRVPLSDMNGLGDYWKFATWLRAYWSAFAIVLLVLCYGLWRRGTEIRLTPRLRRLPRRLLSPAGAIGFVALASFAGLGVYIYVNTNVWNEYRTQIASEKWLADYEKAFLKYEKLPQPSVTDVHIDVDLYPHVPRLEAEGVYQLVNDTGAPIRELHVRLDRDTKALQMAVNGARRVRTFDRFNYRIFTFDRPLMPGERTALSFETLMTQKGFKNSGNTTRVVDNGTFVNNYEFGPIIGMDRSRLLQDRAKRRKYGLPPQLRPPKLEDRSAQARNYVGANWVNADINVTTDADQTPVAPGYRISDVTRDGRRTIRFRTDAPVLNFFSVQSARYAIKREIYKGVELAIYYDPQHPWNVDRMIGALKTGLDYYQANFSPYQFRQARILEFPAYGTFAQAFANTMPYSEAIGFVTDNTKPDKIDYVTYVTAHELAHQWWAHQVIGADMQGQTSLSESLAQYSALIVMEKTYGADGIRKFLKYELDRYLRSRSGELVEEQPLYRVENQDYIHYRKASLVMYLLRDRLGEAKVNAALRRLLAQYAFKGAPYPRSLDLVDALRAEAGADPAAQQLITDLFEKITLYDLKTRTADVKKRPDGRYDVKLVIEAKKAYAGGKGEETPVTIPAGEVFDVGVFDAEPGKPGFGHKNVLLFRTVPLKSGVQTLTFTVDRPPKFAGVDPYNKQIDRDSDDNAIKVSGG